jgi:hypothetical protein
MMTKTTLTCPKCRQGQLLDTGDGTLACLNCGGHFAASRQICPFCKAENVHEAKSCQRCGQALRWVCPRCQEINSIEAEVCAACGQKLDVIGHIVAREELRHVDRFSRRAEGINSMKAADQAQSQQRMDQMWAVEQQRLAALGKAKQAQHRQEMQMMYGALIFLALAIIAAIVIAVLSTHR